MLIWLAGDYKTTLLPWEAIVGKDNHEHLIKWVFRAQKV